MRQPRRGPPIGRRVPICRGMKSDETLDMALRDFGMGEMGFRTRPSNQVPYFPCIDKIRSGYKGGPLPPASSIANSPSSVHHANPNSLSGGHMQRGLEQTDRSSIQHPISDPCFDINATVQARRYTGANKYEKKTWDDDERRKHHACTCIRAKRSNTGRLAPCVCGDPPYQGASRGAKQCARPETEYAVGIWLYGHPQQPSPSVATRC